MSEPQKQKPIAVLIVEDQKSLLSATERMLAATMEGAVILTAKNLRDAQSVVDEQEAKGEGCLWAVLADNDFPTVDGGNIVRGNGLQFAERLRQRLGDRACIILVTGNNLPNPMPTFLNASVQKPYNVAEAIMPVFQKFIDS